LQLFKGTYWRKDKKTGDLNGAFLILKATDLAAYGMEDSLNTDPKNEYHNLALCRTCNCLFSFRKQKCQVIGQILVAKYILNICSWFSCFIVGGVKRRNFH